MIQICQCLLSYDFYFKFAVTVWIIAVVVAAVIIITIIMLLLWRS
jgi:hypothetical protein